MWLPPKARALWVPPQQEIRALYIKGIQVRGGSGTSKEAFMSVFPPCQPRQEGGGGGAARTVDVGNARIEDRGVPGKNTNVSSLTLCLVLF